MTHLELVDFHVRNRTPLRQLGNCVRWYESVAAQARGSERRNFATKAKEMRAVVTAVFVARFQAGEYAEAA